MIDGVIHRPMEIYLLLSNMMDTTAPPLPRNTENQYVILSFGLSEEEKIKLEEFDFTSGVAYGTSDLANKVYLEFTKELNTDQRLTEVSKIICDEPIRIEENPKDNPFTPQKIEEVTPDEYIPDPLDDGILEFCQEEMNLVVLFDTTYNSWRKMKYGQTMREMLIKDGFHRPIETCYYLDQSERAMKTALS